MKYEDFINSKQIIDIPTGFEPIEPSDILYDYQKDIVKWALKRGRAACFLDTGLGKTFVQLEWAKQVIEYTQKPLLILAPLAVNLQTKNEGLKLGINVNLAESQNDIINGIHITNYEKLHKFDLDCFGGIVLDESSILKSFNGATRNQLIESFQNTQFRLCCTATAAPNDYVELGNHSEFLGVMSRSEMLATFFIHDSGDTSKWRLKKHAESEFWAWVSQWAVAMKLPGDLGYSNDGFILPKLNMIEHIVDKSAYSMFTEEAKGLSGRQRARKESLQKRCEYAANLMNGFDDYAFAWCNLNDESKMIKDLVTDCVEVKGSDKSEHKEKSLIGFQNGDIQKMVSKPTICGFGLNFQHCNNVIFVGLSDSYEQLYQAIRRFWRHGQKREVNVHIIISEKEGSVLKNIKRKEKQAEHMFESMVEHMKDLSTRQVKGLSRETIKYNPNEDMILPEWI